MKAVNTFSCFLRYAYVSTYMTSLLSQTDILYIKLKATLVFSILSEGLFEFSLDPL